MMTCRPVPFDRCYWVSERLLAGPVPYDFDVTQTYERVELLLQAGVTTVVSLLGREELHGLAGMSELFEPWLWGESPRLKRQHQFLVRDGATPSVERMTRILNAIDTALDVGETVYVHCIGGRGRTGTVVGCWLARHGISEGEAALAYLASLRLIYGMTKPSPETRSQCRLVQSWPAGQ